MATGVTIRATDKWAAKKAMIKQHAILAGTTAIRKLMNAALTETVRKSDGHVPKYKGGSPPAFQTPEWHAKDKPHGRIVDDDAWRKPWAGYGNAQKFSGMQGEHEFMARMLATLNTVMKNPIPFPENEHLAKVYGGEVPHVFQGADERIHVGCFSVSHLDAETAYDRKLVVFPIGKVNGRNAYLRWQWHADGTGHWVHNAWILTRGGGTEPIPGNVGSDMHGVMMLGRADQSVGHGYWADVEYGTTDRFSSAAYRLLGGETLPHLFLKGADPNVPQHGAAVAKSRTFFVGNLAYLPITYTAGVLYNQLKTQGRQEFKRALHALGSKP